MKKVIELIIIGLVMMMVVGALTPADVVRTARESAKPVINTQGVNASVFKTDAFANLNILAGKHFSSLPVSDDSLSQNTTQNFTVYVPPLIKIPPEPWHKEKKNLVYTVESGSSIDAYLNPKNDSATQPGQSIEDYLNSVNAPKVNETNANG